MDNSSMHQLFVPTTGSESRDAKAAFGIWQSALYMAIPCIYVIVGKAPRSTSLPLIGPS